MEYSKLCVHCQSPNPDIAQFCVNCGKNLSGVKTRINALKRKVSHQAKGKLEEFRRYVYEHSQHKSLPDYRFEKDRQHFVYRNATDAGWPIRGELNISLDKNDPQLIGPGGFWQAGDVPKIYIHAACHTQDTRATIFWKTHSEPGFANNRSVSFQTHPDGQYHIYEIDLSSSPYYKGAIAGLRLDPVSTGKKGDYMKIKYISWEKKHE